MNITNFLFKDIIEFKLKLPNWLIGLIVLVPLMAFGDIFWLGRKTFIAYVWMCYMELLLVFIGFLIGINMEVNKNE